MEVCEKEQLEPEKSYRRQNVDTGEKLQKEKVQDLKEASHRDGPSLASHSRT